MLSKLAESLASFRKQSKMSDRSVRRTDRLNAASDEKFVDYGRLFHIFVTRWEKIDYEC